MSDLTTSRRPVVLFVHGPRSLGGDSVVVLRTIEHLDLTLVDPIVMAPPNCEVWHRFAELETAGRVRLYPLDIGVVSHLEKDLPEHSAHTRSRFSDGLLLAKGFLQLLKLVIRERVDVVYTMDRSRAVPLGTLAARLLGRGLVFHGHCPWNSWGAAVRASDSVVVITEFVKREYERHGIPAERIRVIYNGIDVEAYASVSKSASTRQRLGLESGAPLVVMPGRLSRYKGQLECVEAIPAVLRAHPGAHFAIAGGDSSELGDLAKPGNSSMLAVLRERTVELGVLEHVTFMTPTNAEMAELYAAADVVVVPSWAEPFGLVVIEAMAAGAAVVGSDSGGIPESILDGQTGSLVPPCDPVSLAQAVNRLLADPVLRSRYGQAGQARARAYFTLDRYTREIQDVLLTVVARRRRPARASAAAAAI
jgi:glycosyltransferase involved in cell wall biosynthesis